MCQMQMQKWVDPGRNKAEFLDIGNYVKRVFDENTRFYNMTIMAHSLINSSSMLIFRFQFY